MHVCPCARGSGGSGGFRPQRAQAVHRFACPVRQIPPIPRSWTGARMTPPPEGPAERDLASALEECGRTQEESRRLQTLVESLLEAQGAAAAEAPDAAAPAEPASEAPDAAAPAEPASEARHAAAPAAEEPASEARDAAPAPKTPVVQELGARVVRSRPIPVRWTPRSIARAVQQQRAAFGPPGTWDSFIGPMIHRPRSAGAAADAGSNTDRCLG